MLFHDFFNLFYPNLCICCGATLLRHEECICTDCLCALPRTNMHQFSDNEVEKHFWGKVKIEKGTAFFHFAKGSAVQKLLHELKYKGNSTVGEILGRHAAADLMADNAFTDIDILIPVPLHPKKYHRRGYNQSEMICKGLSQILQKPIDTKHLLRVKENTTQTKKSVFDRYTNTQNIFAVKDPESLAGKHVMLVDDVLTTGATMEACILELLKVPDLKVSIFTLAIA